MQKLRGLKQFVAVCENKSLSSAANALGVTQPALTQSIAKLEKQLDVVLFDRATRPMALTSHGKLVLQYANSLDRNENIFLENLDEIKDGSGGVLRIGAGPDWIHEILPHAISKLQEKFPKIRINLNIALNNDLRVKLDRQEIDIFFASLTDENFNTEYKSRILLREKMHILAHCKHPIHRRQPNTLNCLAKEEWVFTGNDTFGRQALRRLFGQHDVEMPIPSIETNSVRAVINILRHSKKLGFLSRSHVNAFSELKIVQTNVIMPTREGGVIWRSGAPLSPLAENLINQVRTCIKQSAWAAD